MINFSWFSCCHLRRYWTIRLLSCSTCRCSWGFRVIIYWHHRVHCTRDGTSWCLCIWIHLRTGSILLTCPCFFHKYKNIFMSRSFSSLFVWTLASTSFIMPVMPLSLSIRIRCLLAWFAQDWMSWKMLVRWEIRSVMDLWLWSRMCHLGSGWPCYFMEFMRFFGARKLLSE